MFEKYTGPNHEKSPYYINRKEIEEAKNKTDKEARIEKRKKTGEPTLSRRSFLKGGLALAATVAIPTVGKEVLSYFSEPNHLSNNKKEVVPTEEQIKIANSNEEILNAVLEELANRNKGRRPFKPTEEHSNPEKLKNINLNGLLAYSDAEEIDLDPENIQRIIKNKWLQKYSEGGDLYSSLVFAYTKMEPWMDEINKQFRKERVPEKFAYLAIPESHFRIESVSPANAEGPYQFIKSTATNSVSGLTVNDVIDERYDPIKSAGACARCLKDIYDRCQDWDIALSGYNGGFVWEYFRNSKPSERNYSNFVKYLEDLINETKIKVKESNKHIHAVRRGETIASIAKRYKISIQEIRNANNLRSDMITHRQPITIPLNDSNRDAAFDAIINPNGRKENLNYPAKFNAVYEIIESGKLEHLKTGRKIRFTEKRVSGREKNIKRYQVSSGDTLWGLSRKFNVPQEKIARDNSIKDGNIRVGQYINIDISQETPSLRSLAQNSRELERLAKLNPAIRNPESPLPPNFTIRT